MATTLEHIKYAGESKVIQRLCERVNEIIDNGAEEECLVHDVRVDGISVVQDKIAYINLTNMQNQIDDILLLLNVGYWQDENDEHITDELGNRILFN